MMFASLRIHIQPVIVKSAIVTILLLGMQRLRVFEPVELKIFDSLTTIRPDPGTDPRILVVAVTEADIQKLHWPLTGEILDRLLLKLQSYQPRVMGLDIYRDIPQEPGHAQLLQHLRQSENIISICRYADADNPATPPPSGVAPEQVGFSDVVEDNDGVIRRNLLSLNPQPTSACITPFSLALQVSLPYLANKGIVMQSTSNKELQLGNMLFKRLESDSGGYQHVDDHGYQILLRYRKQVARIVTVSQVLEDRLDPAWVKDHVILIGSTATTIKDVFYTPYNSNPNNSKMPGVVVQAQMVSQILSAVLDAQPLFWFLPQWGEVMWITVWTFLGGVLAWRIQRFRYLVLAGTTTLCVLFGTNLIIFIQAGWLPLVPPVLGLVLTGCSVVAHREIQLKQESTKFAALLQTQEQTIARLQMLQGAVASVDAEERIQIGFLLNHRYKITKRLGGGGFSRTYLAEDTQRPGNPSCVVKHLRPAYQDLQFLDVARRLFQTEAEILEILGKHDQIPQLLANFEVDEQFYLVQEFISGHSLQDELTGSCLPEAQVIDLLKDILQVLVFVHSHQAIHRDIKPSNLIRRTSDQHLVLIDFGAVKMMQTQSEAENQTIAIGTAGYSPPEQMMGHPQLNSDLYALGMIAIQALTGIPAKRFVRDPNTGSLMVPNVSEHDTQIWHYLDETTLNLNTGGLLISTKLDPNLPPRDHLSETLKNPDGGESVMPNIDNHNVLVWRHLAQTSAKLATILDRMVAYNSHLRYQSVQEVLKSLEQL
jgi:CHASE2 domain-containing sensor protein/serine/threonine protein kinase